MGLAFDKDDNLYIADSRHRRVRKVDTNGIITTIMGNGFPDLYYGDFTEFTNRCMQDCTVNDNTLGIILDLAIDEDGNIFLPTGQDLHTIGKINTNGVYHTIGGACNPNDSSSGGGDDCLGGEGDYANDVGLNPYGGITYGPNGSIFFVDDYRYIRKIDSSGVFSTVADFGEDTPLGGLTLDPNGNIYVADRLQNYIYRVNIKGDITIVAGTGERLASIGENGDGGFAVDAKINTWNGGYGSGSHFSNNTLYFADSESGRFRSISGVSLNLDTFKEAEDDLVLAEKNSLVHIFDATGLHKKTVNSETGIILRTFHYNESRLQSITDQFGQATTLQYNQDGYLTSITSSTGIVTNLTIDSDKNLTRILFADNTDFTFTYNDLNLLLRKTEPAGNVFTHEYNSIGKLTNMSDELGGSWDYEIETPVKGSSRITITTAEGNTKTIDNTHTSTGKNETETTYPSSDVGLVVRESNNSEATLANGMQQTAQYSIDQEFGYLYTKQVTTKTPEEGLTLEVNTSREYQDTNSDNQTDRFTTTVSINNRETVSVLDRLNSTITITSAAGWQATQTFSDTTLQPLLSQFADLYQFSYEYDNRGNLMRVNQGDREQSMTYDLYNNLVTKTLPEGQVIRFSHDIFGRVTSITRPGDILTGFEYDANGMINKIIRQSGSQYTFSYNKTNKVAAIILPDIAAEPGSGGSYQFGYDLDRQLTTITYPSHGTITNTYTGDRLTSQITSDGTAIALEYEAGNRVKKRTRESESIAYTYDGALLLNTIHAGTIDQTISRTYNNDFQLETLSYADIIQEFYYDDGLLTDINDEVYIYRNSTGLVNSIEDDYYFSEKSFNNYGELSGEEIGLDGDTYDVETSWSVTRNRNGQIVTKSEDFNTPSLYEYTYDDLGHLTTVEKDGSTVESYSYDNNGNRTLDENGNIYTHDAQDRLTGKGSTTFSYNTDGFLASRNESVGNSSYDYSLTGELKQVIKYDGTIITYTYDPLGRRISKAIDGSVVEKYLWYSKTTLLAVYDGSDTLKYRFEYADKKIPLRMIDNNGAVYYYIADHLGSLRQVVDEDGNIVRSIEYDSFGNILVATGTKSDIPFGFAGGLYDADTGLIHFGFRDYAPDIGCWTARDPILFTGKSSNLYAYVHNDPVNFTDRLGLSPKKEDPPPLRDKKIRWNPEDFVKDMITMGGDSLFDAAEQIRYVSYYIDDSEDAEERYHQDLEKIRESEKKADAGASLWSSFVKLVTMGGDTIVDAETEIMKQAGEGIKIGIDNKLK
jgi:RHS repeat-associated protein